MTYSIYKLLLENVFLLLRCYKRNCPFKISFKGNIVKHRNFNRIRKLLKSPAKALSHVFKNRKKKKRKKKKEKESVVLLQKFDYYLPGTVVDESLVNVY